MKNNPLIKIQDNHDFVKIVGPSWSFTVSRSRFTPNGSLPMDIFNKMVQFIDKRSGTIGEACQYIVDNIDTIWADWNKTIDLAIGDNVSFTFKKDKMTGTISKITKNSITVKCSIGLVSVPSSMITKE